MNLAYLMGRNYDINLTDLLSPTDFVTIIVIVA